MYIYMYMYTCLHTVTIHRAEDHIRKSYLTWRNPMRKMGGDLFDEKESTSEGNMSKRVSTMLLPKKWWSSSHGACLNQEFMMMFKFIFHYIPNQTYIYIAFQLQESGFLLRITCKTYMFHFQTIPWICYETSQKKKHVPHIPSVALLLCDRHGWHDIVYCDAAVVVPGRLWWNCATPQGALHLLRPPGKLTVDCS